MSNTTTNHTPTTLHRRVNGIRTHNGSEHFVFFLAPCAPWFSVPLICSPIKANAEGLERNDEEHKGIVKKLKQLRDSGLQLPIVQEGRMG